MDQTIPIKPLVLFQSDWCRFIQWTSYRLTNNEFNINKDGVYSAYQFLLRWLWEYVYFILSYHHHHHHHQIESMTHLLLFRARSWNNGIHCMSFYIFHYSINKTFWKLPQHCPPTHLHILYLPNAFVGCIIPYVFTLQKQISVWHSSYIGLSAENTRGWGGGTNVFW